MRTTIFIFCVFLASFLAGTASAAEVQTVNEPLPEVTLTAPDNDAFLKYLGLAKKPGESFKLDDIDADILMIELFSMYCPYCQNAAPNVNELYELMEKKKGPDLKLALIGIGAKNTELEVETFREGFSIEFPMFADPDLSIYKTLEGAGTPTFIAIKKDGDKKVIFFRKAGGFTDPPEFLESLLKKADVQ